MQTAKAQMEEDEHAALTIQARVRGKQARQKMKAKTLARPAAFLY